MTKEEFYTLFAEDDETLSDIFQRIVDLENHKLILTHMLCEIEIKERRILKDDTWKSIYLS